MNKDLEIENEVQCVKIWYDEIAQDFERRYEGPEGDYWQKFEDEVIDQAINSDRKKILDLGTGAGRYAIRMASRAGEVYGVDISEKMIDLAREKSREAKNLHFEVGDARQLRYTSNYFDAVTSLGMFEYLQDPSPFLNEIHRLLKPGGEFVFTCRGPQNSSLIQRLYRDGLAFLLRKRYLPKPPYKKGMESRDTLYKQAYHRFTDIRTLLLHVGFDQIKFRSTFFYSPTLLFYWGVAKRSARIQEFACLLNRFLGAFSLTKKGGPVMIIKAFKSWQTE